MTIKDYLELMVEKGASDLFFRSGGSVRMRINGKVLSVRDEILTQEDIENSLGEIITDQQKEQFKNSLDIDFAFFSKELGRRFRFSIFMQRNTPSIVVRNISPLVDTQEQLKLPAVAIKKLAIENSGLVL